LKPVGSPAWCWQTLERLVADYKLIDERFDEVGDALDELTKAQAWEVIPSGKPYGSRNRMLAVELGIDTRTIQQEINQARKRKLMGYGGTRVGAGRPKYGWEKKGTNQVAVSHLKSSNSLSSDSRIRILGRLDRDGHPELATKVRANEMSARAAADEAGFHKKRTTLEQLQYLWKKASKQERAAFRREISR
jgi:hypothetical protein